MIDFFPQGKVLPRYVARKKAESYILKCKIKELLYALVVVIMFIVAGIIGTIELHAEPEYVKANPMSEQYPTTGIVTTVSKSGQFLIFTDFNCKEWKLEGDPEDWSCGDIISVIMDDNGTPEIADDTIVSTKYSGWVY